MLIPFLWNALKYEYLNKTWSSSAVLCSNIRVINKTLASSAVHSSFVTPNTVVELSKSHLVQGHGQ